MHALLYSHICPVHCNKVADDGSVSLMKTTILAAHPLTLIFPLVSVLQWQQLGTIGNARPLQLFLISIVDAATYQQHSAVDNAPLSTPSFVYIFQAKIIQTATLHLNSFCCGEPFSAEAPVVHA